MFRKVNVLTFFAVSAFSCGILLAQDAPKAPVKEKTVTVVVDGDTIGGNEMNKEFRILSDNDGGSYLGVQLQDVTKENFAKFGLSSVRGVVVGKVLENAPAKVAGLQDGDVIVRFNGEEVSSVRKLMRLISEVAPDHQAKITVWRGGSEKEFNATMGKRPTPKFESTGWTMAIPPGRFPQGDERISGMRILRQGQPPRTGEFGIYPPTANGDFLVWSSDGIMSGGGKKIGINSMSLTKQLGDYFGVSDGKGILISNVRENSPAAKVGLKAGDVIVEADGKPISDQMGLVKALNTEGKKSVSLTIIRDKKRQTITVEPEVDTINRKILEKQITTNN